MIRNRSVRLLLTIVAACAASFSVYAWTGSAERDMHGGQVRALADHLLRRAKRDLQQQAPVALRGAFILDSGLIGDFDIPSPPTGRPIEDPNGDALALIVAHSVPLSRVHAIGTVRASRPPRSLPLPDTDAVLVSIDVPAGMRFDCYSPYERTDHRLALKQTLVFAQPSTLVWRGSAR